jgi:hypothetical protein
VTAHTSRLRAQAAVTVVARTVVGIVGIVGIVGVGVPSRGLRHHTCLLDNPERAARIAGHNADTLQQELEAAGHNADKLSRYSSFSVGQRLRDKIVWKAASASSLCTLCWQQ